MKDVRSGNSEDWIGERTGPIDGDSTHLDAGSIESTDPNGIFHLHGMLFGIVFKCG
jgi:hypothetical protein